MPKFKKPKNCINCPYKSELFKNVDRKVLRELHNYCFVVSYKKGEAFAKQGTPVSHSLYLTHGLAKLYIEGSRKNTIIKIISPGEFIGLYSIFSDDKLYAFSASAILNSQVCMIEAEYIKHLAKNNKDFAFKVLSEVSKCNSMLINRLSCFNQKNARGRIAEILLYLSEKIYHSNKFQLPLTRKELAELASISHENAVRLLTELKNNKIIDFKDRFFEIRQKDLLEKISLLS